MKWKILLRISLALSDFQMIKSLPGVRRGKGANIGGRTLVVREEGCWWVGKPVQWLQGDRRLLSYVSPQAWSPTFAILACMCH